MTSILIILILLIVFFVLLFSILFYSKRNKKSAKKSLINTSFLKKQQFNPDVSTDNWDLHKLRLDKFRRSQYKGLTFFVSAANRIYYLSEEGDKVYC